MSPHYEETVQHPKANVPVSVRSDSAGCDARDPCVGRSAASRQGGPATTVIGTSPSSSIPVSCRSDRARTTTSTAEIDRTLLLLPGSVTINVQGAFIVDPPERSPTSEDGRSAENGGLKSGQRTPTGHETSDIRLPNHTAVVSHIAVDIGGTLAKLVYFSRETPTGVPTGGRLNFMSFETSCIDECIDFMRHLKEKQQPLNGSAPSALCVMATGGGAFKFYDKVRTALGVDVLREEEMECLIIGLDFFITEIPREVFTYSETDPMHFVPPSNDPYPYLLVNIGSGVSFLKVSGPREYQRVGGTSLGGGTLWGLLSLLTGARTFDEMLELASRGDNSVVDMMVGDIYGTDYAKIGLKSTAIASSFGKVFRMKREAEPVDDHSLPDGRTDAPDAQPRSIARNSTKTLISDSLSTRAATAADVSRSLLYAISNNIGQIAFLQSQIHGLSHIYFGGSFIRGHTQTMNTLSYAIKFWSKGATQAYFLRHEGYLGAVGAFLKRQPREWGRRGSFEEPVEARMRKRLGGREEDDGDEDGLRREDGRTGNGGGAREEMSDL